MAQLHVSPPAESAAPDKGSRVTVVERVYFGIIALAALFVSYGGFLFPKELDKSFTWAVLPPLHARFVGALYLFGGIYMIGCTVARHRSQITPGPPAVIIFTTLLLAVTLLNLEAFDFDLVPVWVWTVSYIVYPFLGLLLIAWTYRRPRIEPPGAALPRWVPTFLLVEAGIFGVAGLLLLFAREVMVDAWPWPISNGLAQFYGGPFLAIAYCCWRYSTRRTWTEIMPIAPAMLA